MYAREYWLDHVMTPSGRYNINRQSDGTYTITRAGTLMQQGTSQDQRHFNSMEERITDAEIAGALMVNSVRQYNERTANYEQGMQKLEKDHAADIQKVEQKHAADMASAADVEAKHEADANIAVPLAYIAMRQEMFNREDATKKVDGLLVMEKGSVTLNNTQEFPFNNSQKSVSLKTNRASNDYIVTILSATAPTGNIGDIVVTDRLTNGFKLAYTGSAPSVTITYMVTGGYWS